MQDSTIISALMRLGEYLSSHRASYTIVIVGGAAINLHGVVSRATHDVDVLAFGGENGICPPPEVWPLILKDGVDAVAEDMGLPRDWMNDGPALQWRQGLPPGLAERIHWSRFGGLLVGIVDRYDLIFFKLYAAADHVGQRNVHYTDLLALQPSPDELIAAATWIRDQDGSEAFIALLDQVLADVRRDSH